MTYREYRHETDYTRVATTPQIPRIEPPTEPRIESTITSTSPADQTSSMQTTASTTLDNTHSGVAQPTTPEIAMVPLRQSYELSTLPTTAATTRFPLSSFPLRTSTRDSTYLSTKDQSSAPRYKPTPTIGGRNHVTNFHPTVMRLSTSSPTTNTPEGSDQVSVRRFYPWRSTITEPFSTEKFTTSEMTTTTEGTLIQPTSTTTEDPTTVRLEPTISPTTIPGEVVTTIASRPKTVMRRPFVSHAGQEYIRNRNNNTLQTDSLNERGDNSDSQKTMTNRERARPGGAPPNVQLGNTAPCPSDRSGICELMNHKKCQLMLFQRLCCKTCNSFVDR